MNWVKVAMVRTQSAAATCPGAAWLVVVKLQLDMARMADAAARGAAARGAGMARFLPCPVLPVA